MIVGLFLLSGWPAAAHASFDGPAGGRFLVWLAAAAVTTVTTETTVTAELPARQTGDPGLGQTTPAQAAPAGPAPTPAPHGLSAGWLGAFITVGLAVAAVVILVLLWRRDVIRPGSFARKPGRRLSPAPWFVWLLAAIVVFMAAQVGGALAVVVSRVPAGAELESLRGTAILSLGSYGVAIVAALAMARLLSPAAEGFSVRPRHVLVGAGCFVAAYPIIHTVSTLSVVTAKLVGGGELPEIAHESLRRIIEHRSDGWAWVLAAAAIVGAPIVEEMMYRVFLQTAILRAWGRPWPAILVTALLFAAIHISIVEPYALPTLFVLGAAMGLAYERTKSPVVPITMHVLFNGLNVVLALLLDRA